MKIHKLRTYEAAADSSNADNDIDVDGEHVLQPSIGAPSADRDEYSDEPPRDKSSMPLTVKAILLCLVGVLLGGGIYLFSSGEASDDASGYSMDPQDDAVNSNPFGLNPADDAQADEKSLSALTDKLKQNTHDDEQIMSTLDWDALAVDVGANKDEIRSIKSTMSEYMTSNDAINIEVIKRLESLESRLNKSDAKDLRLLSVIKQLAVNQSKYMRTTKSAESPARNITRAPVPAFPYTIEAIGVFDTRASATLRSESGDYLFVREGDRVGPYQVVTINQHTNALVFKDRDGRQFVRKFGQ